MLLYFNKNGQLLEQLEYGNAPRVGMTTFQIFAYFKDIDLGEYGAALIRFRRPDLQGSEYPDLFMVRASLAYHNSVENSDYFDETNNPYTGYYFDFNAIRNSDGTVKLLDTPGQWEASITLVSNVYGHNVTGLVRFNVEGSVSSDDDEPIELDISVIQNNMADAIAEKVDKSDEEYIRAHPNFTYAADNKLLPSSFYVEGVIVYDETNETFYRIDSIVLPDEGEIIETVGATYSAIQSPFAVDAFLSRTSTNPVQNKVIRNSLAEIFDGSRDLTSVKVSELYAKWGATTVVAYITGSKYRINMYFHGGSYDVVLEYIGDLPTRTIKRVNGLTGNETFSSVLYGFSEQSKTYQIVASQVFSNSGGAFSVTVGALYSLGENILFKFSDSSELYIGTFKPDDALDGNGEMEIESLLSGKRWYSNNISPGENLYEIITTTTYRDDYIDTTSTQTISGDKRFTGTTTVGDVTSLGNLTFLRGELRIGGTLHEEGEIVTYNRDTFAAVRTVDNNVSHDIAYKLPYDYSNASSSTYTLATTSFVQDQINFAIAGVYKIQGSATPTELNGLTKAEGLNGNVYNISTAGTLTDSDDRTTDVVVGDNVVFVWNEGQWYWDVLSGLIDASVFYDKSHNIVPATTGLDIGSQTYPFKDLYLGGNLTLAGGTTISYDGNNLNIYNGNGNVRFNTNIRPTNNNTYDLGSSSYTWKDLYLSNSIKIGGNQIAVDGYDNLVLGIGSGKDVKNVGVFKPASNNIYDLGTSSAKWKDIYLAGNLSDGTHSYTIEEAMTLFNPPGAVASQTEIKWTGFNILTANSNKTYTFETTKTGCSCEYKGTILNSSSSAITLTFTGVTKILCNDDNFVITLGTDSTLKVPGNTTFEFSIVNHKMIAINFEAE